MSCIVRYCKSHSGRKENVEGSISFHRFPKAEHTRSQWFTAIDRSEKQYKSYWKVCSRHFKPECFWLENSWRARLKENAVPSLNLPSKAILTGLRTALRKLKKSLHCEKCLQALDGSTTNMSLISVKDRGGLTKPSRSIQTICLFAEKILREFEARVTKKSVGKRQHFAAMINQISQRLLETKVLEELRDHSLDNSLFDDHRSLLLKSVSETYLSVRIHHMTKQITSPVEKIRSFLTKTIHFKGQ